MRSLGSSTASSIGMIALANYVSSPSSFGSEYAFGSLPDMLFGTGSQTVLMSQEEEAQGADSQYLVTWIKKPYNKYVSLPKVK